MKKGTWVAARLVLLVSFVGAASCAAKPAQEAMANPVAESQLALLNDRLDNLVRQLDGITDAGYEGGLSRKDYELAESFAAQAFERGTERKDCEAPDPMTGQIIAILDGKEELAQPGEFRNPVFRHLEHFILEGNRKQRDMALLALAMIGPGSEIEMDYLRKLDLETPWAHETFSRVSCRRWGAGDVFDMWSEERRRSLESDSREAVIEFMVHQLLQKELVYPSEVFSHVLSNRGYEHDLTADLLAPLKSMLADDEYSRSSRLEALWFIVALGSHAEVFEEVLLETYTSSEGELKYAAGEALVSLRSRHGADVLADRIEAGDFTHWAWEAREDCIYPPGNARLIKRLAGLVEKSYTKSRAAAARTLGCLQAESAIPVLLAVLDDPFWSLQLEAIGALGRMETLPEEAIAALRDISETHWSSKVRNAALNVLDPVEEIEEKTEESEKFVVVWECFHRCLDNHGLPVCHEETDGNGLYRLPWLEPFRVEWDEARMRDVPAEFPASLKDELAQYREREGYGSNTVLEVEGGWLYSTDLWHYDGTLQFVTRDGEVKDISEGMGAHAAFLLRTDFGITMLGQQLLTEGNGMLARMERNADGGWNIEPLLELPSEAVAYALAPDKTLLVRFGSGAAAITADKEIYPLKCAE